MRSLPQQRGLGGAGLVGQRLQARRSIQVSAQRARVDGRLHLLRMLAHPEGACTLAKDTLLLCHHASKHAPQQPSACCGMQSARN